MATVKSFNFLKKVATFIAETKGFDRLMQSVRIVDGGGGKCIAEFKVLEEHLNRGGGLHGGFIATLVDNVTTYALMSHDSHPGVSVNLAVNYLKGAKEGDEVIVEANTIKKGKTLAYIDCELRHKSTGVVIARGEQTKFVGF